MGGYPDCLSLIPSINYLVTFFKNSSSLFRIHRLSSLQICTNEINICNRFGAARENNTYSKTKAFKLIILGLLPNVV